MAETPNIKPPTSDEAYLQIGEVAERTGVTQRTLRFYEEKGLLKPPTRMEGGFRLYSDADIERVEQIKQLQQLLGFPLAEIKDMMDAEEVLRQLRAEYRAESAVPQKKAQLVRAIEVTQHQFDIIQRRVGELTEMEARLAERLRTFDDWMQRLDEHVKAKSKAKV